MLPTNVSASRTAGMVVGALALATIGVLGQRAATAPFERLSVPAANVPWPDPATVVRLAARLTTVIGPRPATFDPVAAIRAGVTLERAGGEVIAIDLPLRIAGAIPQLDRCELGTIQHVLQRAWGTDDDWADPVTQQTAELTPDCALRVARYRTVREWVATIPFDLVGQPVSALDAFSAPLRTYDGVGRVYAVPALGDVGYSRLCVSIAGGRITGIAIMASARDQDVDRAASLVRDRWGVEPRADSYYGEIRVGTWRAGGTCWLTDRE